MNRCSSRINLIDPRAHNNVNRTLHTASAQAHSSTQIHDILHSLIFYVCLLGSILDSGVAATRTSLHSVFTYSYWPRFFFSENAVWKITNVAGQCKPYGGRVFVTLSWQSTLGGGEAQWRRLCKSQVSSVFALVDRLFLMLYASA